MKTPTYFVAIDFSQSSYNALQYASLLAKRTGGSIKLVHIIEPDTIAESDNPVAVTWCINRLMQDAEEKMKSLREIIAGNGPAVEEEIAFGNVRLEILKRIEKMKPDMIILGRNTDSRPIVHNLVAYITRATKIPVLVVPHTHDPKVPAYALLATDFKSGDNKMLAPLFDIVSEAPNQLSVFNLENGHLKTTDAADWLSNISSTYAVEARLLSGSSDDAVSGILDFVESNPVDLLCTVERDHGLLKKYFEPTLSRKLVDQVNVPVLMISA